MRSIYTMIALVLLCFVLNSTAKGQEDSTFTADSTVASTAETPEVDTVSFVPSIEGHPAARVSNTVDLEEHLHQNPTGALFKSMLVPGWGQYGNRSYIKAGVVVGLQTWFISSAVQAGREASDAKLLFDQAPNFDRFTAWDNKRKSRNQYIWLAGIVTFLSMFDAYVDAHLSGSPTDPKNDKFGLEIGPTDQGGISAALNYNF